MYTNILSPNTKNLLNILNKTDLIRDFYLTGGTALSLLMGYRESQDLDFFNQKNFEPELIQKKLETVGNLKSVAIETGTLNCFLDNVKLQFLYYPYSLLEPILDWENIQISSKLDIACTKLITISARGSKKDFIDLYFLLKEYDLQTLFEKLKVKYPKTDYNETHILKSLVYFVDANEQPWPRMHKDVSWEEIKEEIISNVKNLKI
jgi:hypothetical protein